MLKFMKLVIKQFLLEFNYIYYSRSVIEVEENKESLKQLSDKVVILLKLCSLFYYS